MGAITAIQQTICLFLLTYTQEHGFPPSVREIAQHIGVKSPSTVHFHLKNLRLEGLVRTEDGQTRSLTLTDKGLAFLGKLETETPPPGRVPLLGDVAAGCPIWAEERVEDYIPYDPGPNPEDYFALRVRGESMLYAGILPGDFVIVHKQESARSGEIVVALFEDEATVKTLSIQSGHPWLLPQNPDYSPIDGAGAQILGKVTALVRQY